MTELDLLRLPQANPGGVTQETRDRLKHWCETDATVADLCARGLWTDLHDRAAVYAPFPRAQEHSAQIPRAVLETYESAFKNGRINLLNCSTTMEMGVDIPDVSLVVNANRRQ
jgi:Lhr-like helicase